MLPALELIDTASEHPMDFGMWVAEIRAVSDIMLMPFATS